MTTSANATPSGMKGFIPLWLGQLISLTGTGMTRFAVTVWAFQTTGSAESLAWVGLFSFVPIMLMTPFAGALTDRWNRKVVLAISDVGAALASLFIAVLYFAGSLEIWHLMAAGAIGGLFEAFQWPALSASVTTMVDKKDYTRANGLLSLADWGSRIAAPVVAAWALAATGLGNILIIDIATCVISVVLVFLSRIPQPAHSATDSIQRESLLTNAFSGFVYIWRNVNLLWLAGIFFFINFFNDLAWILAPPMILTRTGDNTQALGLVQSAAGLGGFLGGVVLSVWGGTRRKTDAVLSGFILAGLCGITVLGMGQSLPWWMLGVFIAVALMPIAGGSSQAIWQSKVPAALQGRVFAARRVTAQVSAPLGMVLGGVLADRVFEPAMLDPQGPILLFFSQIVGTGAGSGMALMIMLAGIGAAMTGVIGYMIPALRDIEKILPDASGAAPLEMPTVLVPDPEVIAT